MDVEFDHVHAEFDRCSPGASGTVRGGLVDKFLTDVVRGQRAGMCTTAFGDSRVGLLGALGQRPRSPRFPPKPVRTSRPE